jgi:hypothetical protein
MVRLHDAAVADDQLLKDRAVVQRAGPLDGNAVGCAAALGKAQRDVEDLLLTM